MLLTAIPSLSKDGIEVTYVRLSILLHQYLYQTSYMNQQSTSSLLLSIKDFSPSSHTSVMIAKCHPLHPKEWIWIIWLPPKLCNVHSEDDIESEEYSKHSKRSTAYRFSFLSSHCCMQSYHDIGSLRFQLSLLLFLLFFASRQPISILNLHPERLISSKQDTAECHSKQFH